MHYIGVVYPSDSVGRATKNSFHLMFKAHRGCVTRRFCWQTLKKKTALKVAKP